MSYQVLARKWRPQTFSEVVGQSHIVKTIKNSIQNNRVAQAYLFTGTRGVGKTTIVRLFAKSLMCLDRSETLDPCGVCKSCESINKNTSMDFIEIDGATNNGVESIRSLIENVQYLPTQGNYKVYAIDEVHMLSVSAFNALLKTLEEPPKHVIFIFATTDPQKLLGTVLSRCQRFDFKNLSVDELSAHVKLIAGHENIKFQNDNIIRKLAKQGNGSARDTLSLFDQIISLSNSEVITDDNLTYALGLANTTALTSIINSLLVGSSNECLGTFEKVLEENVDLQGFVRQLLESLFFIIQNIDNSEKLQTEEFVKVENLVNISMSELFWIYEVLSKDLEWALSSFMPTESIYIVLKKVCMRKQLLGQTDQSIIVEQKKKAIIKQVEDTEEVAIVETVEVIETVEDTEANQEEKERSIYSKENFEVKDIKEVHLKKVTDSRWSKILEDIREIDAALAANLEHGNLLSVHNTEDSVTINYGFSESGKVFYDYVSDAEIFKKIVKFIADIFKLEENKVNFELKYISINEKDESNFQSMSEIRKENQVTTEEQKISDIRDNRFIKEAEDIFSAKVDKVILNKNT